MPKCMCDESRASGGRRNEIRRDSPTSVDSMCWYHRCEDAVRQAAVKISCRAMVVPCRSSQITFPRSRAAQLDMLRRRATSIPPRMQSKPVKPQMKAASVQQNTRMQNNIKFAVQIRVGVHSCSLWVRALVMHTAVLNCGVQDLLCGAFATQARLLRTTTFN